MTPEPVPDLEEVKAAMRDGVRFQIGGGRSFATYVMTDGHVVVTQSDDGFTEESPCSDDRLRSAIAEARDVFAQVIAWWKEGRYKR